MHSAYGEREGRQNQCNCEDDDSGLAIPPISGGEVRNDQNQVIDSDCKGRGTGRSNRYATRSASAGKILSQLRKLQADHLAYVESHGNRLQQRLNEYQEHRAEILVEMKQLEEDLLTLLREQGEIVDE